MSIFDVMNKRHSCRELAPVEIPQPDLEKIMDAGRRAPSGLNLQPYDFLVITNKDDLAELACAQKFMSQASAAIVIIAHPHESKYWLEDVCAVAENMLLAITAMGYASTWIEGTLRSREDHLKSYFGVPQDSRFMIALPIGKPARKGTQAKKRDLDTIIHWDRW